MYSVAEEAVEEALGQKPGLARALVKATPWVSERATAMVWAMGWAFQPTATRELWMPGIGRGTPALGPLAARRTVRAVGRPPH
jgi:hypothetical protein